MGNNLSGVFVEVIGVKCNFCVVEEDTFERGGVAIYHRFSSW
jgi:hypothetical protein